MRVNKRKVTYISLILFFNIVNIFLTIFFVNGTRIYSNFQIQLISFIALFELIVASWLWIKLTKEVFSPFLWVFIVACLFGIGQVLCWVFKIPMELDLKSYPTIGMHYVGDSLIYTLDGLMLFILGGMLAYKVKVYSMNHVQTEKNLKDISAIKKVSTVLLIVSTPFAFVNLYNILSAVFVGGYSEFYSELNSYSKFGQFVPLIAGWFPISLLMQYSVNIQCSPKKSKLAKIVFFIYVTINLYVGGRSSAVILIIAFLVAKYYLGKPFKKKNILPMAIGVYLFVGILNAIKDLRLETSRSLVDFISAVTLSIGTTIGGFIGEMGWSMSSLAWTMKLINMGDGFRYGQSYIYAFTAIIPNLGFWEIHPATLHSDMGKWLMDSLGRTTGLGYTFIAETYANFSWFGLIMMFVWGVILSSWFTRVSKITARYNYKYTIIIIVTLAVLLKSFVRSQFSAIMRGSVFTVILISVMISFFREKFKDKR